MAELAVATGTMPSQWMAESDAVLATVLEVLADQADAMKPKAKRRK